MAKSSNPQNILSSSLHFIKGSALVRVVIITLLLFFFCQIKISLAEELTSLPILTNIRYSVTKEKVRVVLDFDKMLSYQIFPLVSPPQITINICANLRETLTLPVLINDRVVKGVRSQESGVRSQESGVRSQESGVRSQESLVTNLIIDLSYFVPFNYFTLVDPERLVFDFFKIYEHKSETFFVPGLKVSQIKKGTTSGPLSINVLDVDVNNPSLKVKPVLSNQKLKVCKPLSLIVKENKALGGINGGYFAKGGLPLGLLLLDGEIIKEDIFSRSSLGITKKGRIIVDSLEFKGSLVKSSGESLLLSGINRPRGEEEIILYTPWFGETTQTNIWGKDFVIVDDKITAVYEGNAPIPPQGCVVSFQGEKAKLALELLPVGEEVRLNLELKPYSGELEFALGAGPRLIKDGDVFITSDLEYFKPDIALGRSPRSALGVTLDNHLLLVAVDGRQKNFSIGMTLEELAKFLLTLRASDALNLDGGASTAMVVGDKVLNRPSSGGRKIPTSLLIYQKAKD